MLPLVTDAQARDAVSAQDAIDIVEQTYGDLGSARASLSDPELMRLDHDAWGFALKGAVLDRYGTAGVRVIPSHLGGGNGWCLLLDTASGRPLARVEETWLHRLRTAASAVVTARLLARPDSRVLTLVGTGRIADLVPPRARPASPSRRSEWSAAGPTRPPTSPPGIAPTASRSRPTTASTRPPTAPT
ncbi:hypothetical protein [Dactylosporangium cerinum]